MKTLVHVRTIEHPDQTADDFRTKRALVNQIEACGFVCRFYPGLIEVYAQRYHTLWDIVKEAVS